MTRIFGLVFLVCTAWLSFSAQQALSDLFNSENGVNLHGHIILYDWASHETTSGDDFVVKTADPGTPYARVIYKPFWGFDAPSTSHKDVLDRWAFVGRGATWSFVVRAPHSVEEKAACSAFIVNHRYEDETGIGEIPRFVSTPGANVEKTPSVQTLPCFILKHNGLAISSGTGKLESGIFAKPETNEAAQ
jgi:hypothetical protein